MRPLDGTQIHRFAIGQAFAGLLSALRSKKISSNCSGRSSGITSTTKLGELNLYCVEFLAHDVFIYSIIRQKAEAQWANLPPQFRLSGTLRECSGNAFERDILASIRLDQLHVLFLLQLSVLDTLTEPGPSILDISDQMLALVVEVILLRDQLVNSGTGLVWKVFGPTY
jgi:hypothetical protein